jgi:periplasmic protein CpxP/Spy
MRTISIILLFLSFSVAAFAGKDTEARAKTLTDNLEKSLSLTAEQKTNVYKVVLAKMEAVEKLDKASDQIKIEKRKFYMEMKNVLTEEQYKKWNELRNAQVEQTKKGEKVANPVFDKDIELMLH